MNNKLTRWINEITPYVANYIKKGYDIQMAIQYASKDYMSTLAEMANCKSERSKKVTDILCKLVYEGINK